MFGFGLDYEPLEAEVTAVRRLFRYLADRRVLFDPYQLEVPAWCVQSVLDIRSELTSELQRSQRDESAFATAVEMMRAACRKFLHSAKNAESIDLSIGLRSQTVGDFMFDLALGEFRSQMGVQVARLAATFKVDVPEILVNLVPPEPDSGDENVPQFNPDWLAGPWGPPLRTYYVEDPRTPDED